MRKIIVHARCGEWRSCRYYYYSAVRGKKRGKREKKRKEKTSGIQTLGYRFIRPLADLTASFPVPAGTVSRAERNKNTILLSTRELSEESPYQICIERTSEPRRKIDISGGNESEVETYPLPVHSNSRREKGSNLNFIYFLI